MNKHRKKKLAMDSTKILQVEGDNATVRNFLLLI